MFKEEITEGEYSFSASIIQLENAIFVVFDERGQTNIGTLAVALPPKRDVREPSISSILIGDRNIILTKLLAESAASLFGQMAFTSTHFEEINDTKISRMLLELLKKLYERSSSISQA
jgi:hypothetical protein